jgi:pimeloyl-ACP methyl ester carboxylesterase
VGRGPALFVLASLGRGPAHYDHLTDLLTAQGVRVLRPYPRGIGASHGPMKGLTLHDLAADVATIIQAESLATAAIAGHAYGNFVARTLATDRPDLVRGVALVAASAGKTPDGGSPFAPDVLESVYRAGDLSLS